MCQTTANLASAKREVLPGNVTPVHYAINITPNLGGDFVFAGSVAIKVKVNEATTSIVTNANELDVKTAKVTVDGVSQEATSITYEKELERVTFTFADALAAGSEATLELAFTGVHNDKLAGFYRSAYTGADGSKKHLVVTQFEATDARRCFPCWDEPNVKATFDVILNVDLALVALSNMNVIEEKHIQVDGRELKAVHFATTPIVSTYLVAFAVGDFEFIETTSYPKKPEGAKPITVRVYTLPGEVERGRFALGVAARTLEYFSEYFNAPYPLPKMDMIAIPDFGAGAMENWGLVTYRTVALLFDEKNSSVRAKQQIAYVVGHELAHQWFGNLVTMDWWSDLWLNEGFATFVGWMAVDNLFPEWDVWTQFLGDFTAAQNLDGLRSSHPIEVEVQKAHEINQIFDAISYLKGGSVIRMISSYLGKETFMNGVRSYLQEFKFRNASTVDLWRHLGLASGKDVEGLMYVWTRKIGFPIVTVESEVFDAEKNELTITLRQNRFLSSGDVKDEEDETLWTIPLLIISHLSSHPSDHILTDRHTTVTIPYTQAEGSWWKLNSGSTGFYRTSFQESQIKALAHAISTNINAFSTTDRVGVVNDAFALAKAGYASTTVALEVLTGYDAEQNFVVLDEIHTHLAGLRNAFYLQPEDVVDGLKALQRSIFSRKAAQVGLDYPASEDHLDTMKRSLVVGAAARADDAVVIADLKERFARFIAGDESALHPNLRGTAYAVVLSNSTQPEADLEAILNIYKTAPAQDQRLVALGAIGHVPKFELVDRVLELTLDQNLVRSQDLHYPIISLCSGPLKKQVLPYVWDWIVKNWTTLHERLSATMSLMGHVLAAPVGAQIGDEVVKRVEDWASGAGLPEEERSLRVEQVKAASMKLNQTLEHVRSKTKWVERDAESVTAWVKLHVKA
ncbi:peptidase family M1-domain-containing protein [Polychytrium aggregatum]|uniref:peptidase family M1-domain-containing protein n=1 Tax=Polychytrium aggregatum TaxID=110093 RepID=UPI0022FDE2DC|nr:peptidase family M1-domain-containing protein [Polychytrium aggregatum]KAI9209573.1 peptidase family M1-domain-containing protein [Polychytrium aggregatum]